MKRMFRAGLLALPALLAAHAPATAQNCATGNCGGGLGMYTAGSGFGAAKHLSCPFGICFNMFGGMHQDGPLFNYGPYAGYYPFAPYGPWNSDLSYNAPGGGGNCGAGGANCGWNPNLFHRRANRGCGAAGCGGRCGGAGCGTGLGLGGLAGLGQRLGGLGGGSCAGSACGSPEWGQYAMTTLRGVFHRCHPLCHKAKISTGCCVAPASGCGDCAGAASVPAAPVVKPVSAESADAAAGEVRAYRER